MKTNLLKTGLIVLFISTASWSAKAQQLTGDITQQTPASATTSKTNVSVKLIDNKGTIKYLQVANGLTSLTNSTNDRTTTTWQLGGTLTDDTYIDVNDKVFALDGLALIDSATISPSTNTTSGSLHGTGETGWTVLVRDEATGAIKKLKAENLIQSGRSDDTADAGEETAGVIAVNAPGVSQNLSKVWVFRKGAKLNSSDFTLSTDTVTITEVSNSWELFNGDVFEIQWVK